MGACCGKDQDTSITTELNDIGVEEFDELSKEICVELVKAEEMRAGLIDMNDACFGFSGIDCLKKRTMVESVECWLWMLAAKGVELDEKSLVVTKEGKVTFTFSGGKTKFDDKIDNDYLDCLTSWANVSSTADEEWPKIKDKLKECGEKIQQKKPNLKPALEAMDLDPQDKARLSMKFAENGMVVGKAGVVFTMLNIPFPPTASKTKNNKEQLNTISDKLPELLKAAPGKGKEIKDKKLEGKAIEVVKTLHPGENLPDEELEKYIERMKQKRINIAEGRRVKYIKKAKNSFGKEMGPLCPITYTLSTDTKVEKWKAFYIKAAVPLWQAELARVPVQDERDEAMWITGQHYLKFPSVRNSIKIWLAGCSMDMEAAGKGNLAKLSEENQPKFSAEAPYLSFKFLDDNENIFSAQSVAVYNHYKKCLVGCYETCPAEVPKITDKMKELKDEAKGLKETGKEDVKGAGIKNPMEVATEVMSLGKNVAVLAAGIAKMVAVGAAFNIMQKYWKEQIAQHFAKDSAALWTECDELASEGKKKGCKDPSEITKNVFLTDDDKWNSDELTGKDEVQKWIDERKTARDARTVARKEKLQSSPDATEAAGAGAAAPAAKPAAAAAEDAAPAAAEEATSPAQVAVEV